MKMKMKMKMNRELNIKKDDSIFLFFVKIFYFKKHLYK